MRIVGSSEGLATRVATATLVVCAVVLGLLLVAVARDVLFLSFAGVLLAIAVRAGADFLRRHTRVSEGWSVALVILAGLAFVAGMAALFVPRAVHEAGELGERLPSALAQLRAWLGEQAWGERALALLKQAEQATPAILSSAEQLVFGVLGAVGALVLVLAVGLYLSIDPRTHVDGVLRLFPLRQRDRARSIGDKMAETLRHWLVGQLLAMTAVGILTGVGLALLGVPMAASLGLLAAILDFVPNFGPFAAGLPAVLLALTVSPDKALYVVLLYVAIQQVEGNVITPLIQKKAVELPPVVTLTTQVIFGIVAGPLGLIFATPLAAVGMVLAKELLEIRDARA